MFKTAEEGIATAKTEVLKTAGKETGMVKRKAVEKKIQKAPLKIVVTGAWAEKEFGRA